MQISAPETAGETHHLANREPEARAERGGAVLRLVVRNHPGVMSHICGLFARRCFNLEAIVCLPIGDATRSVILLVADEDARLDQVLRQLRKLEDVVEVRRAPEARGAFAAVGHWLR